MLVGCQAGGGFRTVAVCIKDSSGLGYEWCRQLLLRGDNVIAACADPSSDQGLNQLAACPLSAPDAVLKEVVTAHRAHGSGIFRHNTIEAVPLPSSSAGVQGLPSVEYLILTDDRFHDVPCDFAGAVKAVVDPHLDLACAFEENVKAGHPVNGQRWF